MKNFTLLESSKKTVLRNIAMCLCCVLMLSMFMLGSSVVAYCDDDPGDAIQAGINAMATQIYTVIRQVAVPITIVIFAVAGVQFLIGGAKGTEKARTTVFAGVGGLCIIIFAPVFGQAVATWFAGIGTGDLSNYNPLLS